MSTQLTIVVIGGLMVIGGAVLLIVGNGSLVGPVTVMLGGIAAIIAAYSSQIRLLEQPRTGMAAE
jgi:hypothetical protein